MSGGTSPFGEWKLAKTAIHFETVSAQAEMRSATTVRALPLVSVVIPCLNEETTIQECVRRAWRALDSAVMREFAERWSGTGEEKFVDADVLRREWLKPQPHDDSAMLLHAAWLREQD